MLMLVLILYPVFLFASEEIVNQLYITNPPAYFFQSQQGFPLNACRSDNNQSEVWQSEVVVPGLQYRHPQHHGVPRLSLTGHHAPDGVRAGGWWTGLPGRNFTDHNLREGDNQSSKYTFLFYFPYPEYCWKTVLVTCEEVILYQGDMKAFRLKCEQE